MDHNIASLNRKQLMMMNTEQECSNCTLFTFDQIFCKKEHCGDQRARRVELQDSGGPRESETETHLERGKVGGGVDSFERRTSQESCDTV